MHAVEVAKVFAFSSEIIQPLQRVFVFPPGDRVPEIEHIEVFSHMLPLDAGSQHLILSFPYFIDPFLHLTKLTFKVLV